jgi:PKD repeat protein
MEQQPQQLEALVRKAFDKQRITPSDRVLRKLKTRLRMAEFLSLNPRKFNILYTSLLVGTVAAIFLLYSSNDDLQVPVNSGKVLTVAKEQPASSSYNAATGTGSASNIAPSITESEAGAAFIALFAPSVQSGCAPLKVTFSNHSTGGINWQWDFGTGQQSSAKNPEYIYTKPGKYHATLRAKNKTGQEDIFSQEIEVLEKPLADFEIDINNSDIGKRNLVFNNLSEGAISYTWDFGDGHAEHINKPSYTYADFGIYKISLTVVNENGCSDTAVLTNKFIEKNYELSFPLSFKPNPITRSNGYYDNAGMETSVFYPRNFGADSYEFCVYAPTGLKVFSTTNIKQGWNGYMGGRLAPSGVYSWTADGVYPNGKSFKLKGSVKVISQEFD